MNTLKYIISWISLFVYVLFSQFVFRARATTDTALVWSSDVCVIKKIDALGGQYAVREAHNSAVFEIWFDTNFFALDIWVLSLTPPQFVTKNTTIQEDTLGFYAHAPPDYSYTKDMFTKRYVWVTLLLS